MPNFIPKPTYTGTKLNPSLGRDLTHDLKTTVTKNKLNLNIPTTKTYTNKMDSAIDKRINDLAEQYLNKNNTPDMTPSIPDEAPEAQPKSNKPKPSNTDRLMTAVKSTLTAKTKINPDKSFIWNSVDDFFSNLGHVQNVAEGLVNLTEAASDGIEECTGRDKLTAVVNLLEKLIMLPAWLEWLDDIVLPKIVNGIVDQYNEKSKSWGPVSSLITFGVSKIVDTFVVKAK